MTKDKDDPEMMTLEQVMAYIGVGSRMTVVRLQRNEGFPKQIEYTKRTHRWVRSEVAAWRDRKNKEAQERVRGSKA